MNPDILVLTRRSIIAVGAGALITACAPQAAEADDMVLGRQDAPVTLIEYASSTCGSATITEQPLLIQQGAP